VRDGLDQVLEVRYDENTGAAVVQRGAGGAVDALELVTAGTSEAMSDGTGAGD
jgi:hypothetical protein